LEVHVVEILTFAVRAFDFSAIQLEHIGKQLAALTAPDHYGT
jgi:hypothetical protein